MFQTSLKTTAYFKFILNYPARLEIGIDICMSYTGTENNINVPKNPYIKLFDGNFIIKDSNFYETIDVE